ncbi:hypothetical protein MNV49_002112 [Pseudohyphozyma bogoriensis]|nr:hypothetical protein MNV49_002112 [Pseudohyphozyma bogoriensis]
MYTSTLRTLSRTVVPRTSVRSFASTSLRPKTATETVKDAAQTVNQAAGAAALKGIEAAESVVNKAKDTTKPEQGEPHNLKDEHPFISKAKEVGGKAKGKGEELKQKSGGGKV